MKENIEDFFGKMLEFFPNKTAEYNIMCHEMQQDYSERLDTVIIEDLFMPEVIGLLRNNQNKVILKKCFVILKQYLIMRMKICRIYFLLQY